MTYDSSGDKKKCPRCGKMLTTFDMTDTTFLVCLNASCSSLIHGSFKTSIDPNTSSSKIEKEVDPNERYD